MAEKKSNPDDPKWGRLREVFSDGGAHEDAVPTEHQKSRFNVLFPRD
jgi:hypothetical protein